MKEINKTANMVVRISEKDKENLRQLAKDRDMAMSELVVYLIRREVDLDRLGLHISPK